MEMMNRTALENLAVKETTAAILAMPEDMRVPKEAVLKLMQLSYIRGFSACATHIHEYLEESRKGDS